MEMYSSKERDEVDARAVSLMPPILQEFSIIIPLSHVVGVVRALMITGDFTSLPFDLIGVALFDVLLFAMATASFRRIIE